MLDDGVEVVGVLQNDGIEGQADGGELVFAVGPTDLAAVDEQDRATVAGQQAMAESFLAALTPGAPSIRPRTSSRAASPTVHVRPEFGLFLTHRS